MSRVRIGVFVCHCGSNIGGVVRIAEVVAYARTLPLVRLVDDNLYTCSDAGLSSIKQMVFDHDLNRVVVASCTPRTHEELFRRTCEEAGVNRYLFEFVNIREHCSWIHMNAPDAATEKAKELVRLGVMKAAHLEPLVMARAPVKAACLVIGAGVAGLSAARTLASQGFEVHLVERTDRLGGTAADLWKLLPGDRPAVDLVVSLAGEVERQNNVTLYLKSSVEDISGFIGAFDAVVKTPKGSREISVGTVIVATGARELEPLGLYRLGELPGVMTQGELERALSRGRKRFGSVVFINCAGARMPGRTFCGRLCCAVAIKNARYLKELNPSARVNVLERDVMAFGADFEREYRKAREAGVRFIRYDPESPPEILGNGRVKGVRVHNSLSGEAVTLPAGTVVLTTPLVPNDGADDIAKMLKVPRDEDGFFLEAHVKLRPVEFATDGVYIAGAARFPANVREAVSQGMAAAAKAAAPMRAAEISVEATTAVTNPARCSGCGNCEAVCPFQAVTIANGSNGKPVSVINAVLCKGCGACVAACPNGAVQQKGFTDLQIFSMIESLARGKRGNGAMSEGMGRAEAPAGGRSEYEPQVLVFACNWCSYAGADMAGVARLQMPPNCRVLRVMCSARVRPEMVISALSMGVDGVLVLGCHPGDCHYVEGNYFTRRRAPVTSRLLETMGIEPERFQVRWVSAAEGAKFAETVRDVVRKVAALGPNPMAGAAVMEGVAGTAGTVRIGGRNAG